MRFALVALVAALAADTPQRFQSADLWDPEWGTVDDPMAPVTDPEL